MRVVERVDGRAYLTLGSQHNTYCGAHHVIEYFEGPVTALEHVAFRAANAEALEHLCQRLQKAAVAVWAGELEPGITGAILRCDADHHAAGIGRGTDGLFPVAFEVDSMAELARLADALGREGRCLSWGPGRHGAGDNVATYHTDPSGVPIEVFWDMQRIDDEAWQPRTWSFEDYRFINQWGPMGDVPGLLGISIPNVRERGQQTA